MPMCVRCNNGETIIHGQMCQMCQRDMTFDLAPKEHADDSEVIEHYVVQRILTGCLECGNNGFAYDAGVKFEDNVKWYVMFVNCGECGSKYTDILEVRANDSNEDE